MEEDIKYPYIVFKIAESYYCINSRYIATIVQLPHYDKIPAAPANVTGMFRYRDQVIQMLDLRKTFGLQTLAEECQAFEDMIDARKQDHIKWVNELERTLATGEPFQLARNPHMCALGKWYDQFIAKSNSENSAVLFHLKKIEEPHARLHHAAEEVELCQKESDTDKREKHLAQILNCVMDECMPVILELLDETKAIFRSSFYKEMVLLLDGMQWGIVVDEIEGVHELEMIGEEGHQSVVNKSPYILNVLQGEIKENLIFELNVDTLLQELRETDQKLHQ